MVFYMFTVIVRVEACDSQAATQCAVDYSIDLGLRILDGFAQFCRFVHLTIQYSSN